MPKPPPLSDEQRRQALAKAAEARKVRARVKEQLRSGSLDLEGLLKRSDSEEMIAKMKVLSVLESLPRVGFGVSGSSSEASYSPVLAEALLRCIEKPPLRSLLQCSWCSLDLGVLVRERSLKL